MSLALSSLPQRVLQRLSVIEVGGTVETAHDTLIDSAYQEVYQGLVDEGLLEFGNAEDIPDNRALAMIALTADQVKHEFEVMSDVRQSVSNEAAGAIAFLRRKATNRASKFKTIEFTDF